ncbi:MAG: AraC family transcriptional regulator [Pseudomonadales bacterium]|nr:AraC family transcriptional regulator [Pseudomonadales bacterium]
MTYTEQANTVSSPTPELLNVSANHVGLIARELSKRGVDVEAMFAEAGVDVPQTHSPSKRISVEQIIKLLKLAIEKTDDPTMAVKIFSKVQLGDLDALGFAVSCSSTYLSLLQRFQRFSKYIMSSSNIQIIEEPDGYLFLAEIEDNDDIVENNQDKDNHAPGLSHFSSKYKDFIILLEALGTGFVKMSNDVCQEKMSPMKAYLITPSHPLVMEEIRHHLDDCEVVLAPFCGVKFNKNIADKKLPMANPQMARINDEIIVKQIDEMFQNDIVFRVESMIRDGLAIGEFSRSDVAVKLGMSERSLQQRLDDRKTSFSDILLRVRKTLAMQFIREDKLRINQIAYALGFTNGSNFSRSFKSWTGYTPNEFKEL